MKALRLCIPLLLAVFLVALAPAASAAAATDYILNLMKTSKKFRDDTDMVSSIALLQNIIKTNKKGFDSQYGKYIEQIRRNREAGRSGNLTVASEYDRKENELGYV